MAVAVLGAVAGGMGFIFLPGRQGYGRQNLRAGYRRGICRDAATSQGKDLHFFGNPPAK